MLSTLAFLNPVFLAALALLPVLWYLMRVMPPAPRKIAFAATRFLHGLVPEKNVPSKTPWWILLLRLLIIALIITALARPVLNPAEGLQGRGAVRLIMDNSWAGAQNWDKQQRAAQELLAQADRQNREIYIYTTTAPLGEEKPRTYGPMVHNEALAIVKGLSPVSWPANYEVLLNVVKDKKTDNSLDTIWLSHGLAEQPISPLISELQRQGSLTFIVPTPENLPQVIRPPLSTGAVSMELNDAAISIEVPSTIPQNFATSVKALGENGITLDVQTVELTPSKARQDVSFDIPDHLKNTVESYKLMNRKGAGAVFLLDAGSKKRNIGIVSSEENVETAPLVDAGYYLKRALEPHANLSLGTVKELTEGDNSMIILPDVAAMSSASLNALENWVKNGGVLLRFSGPKMAESINSGHLLPVQLRAGERALSGSLSWDEPQKISPFPNTSPFFNIDIPSDIIIKQQLLADPAQDLEGKIWATLEDGTPLITASALERGMIVLIHTSATPDWSNLPISGLYVNLLKRLSHLSSSAIGQTNTNYENLDPFLIIDGKTGGLIPAPATVKPLPVKNAQKKLPDSLHPPGIYGKGAQSFAFNIGVNLPPLKTIKNLPVGVGLDYYESDYEIDLMPYLLYAALLLFLVDWVVVLAISGLLSGLNLKRPASIALVALILLPANNAYAQSEDDLRYAKGFHLAYIRTGDQALDQKTYKGLEALAEALKTRTSVEPEGVIALNPATDPLTFFPIIYWAVSPTQDSIDSKSFENIQSYLNHGGTIFFDLRDQSTRKDNLANSPAAKALRKLTASLNIPPLEPIKDDHVLGRAFYLLSDFPGRLKDGTLWLQQDITNNRDGVSPVIIGSNDWAAAWAAAARTPNSRSRVTRSILTRQNELAIRFGVNLVMYSLTGNYKTDQVHIPHILKRLGQ